MYADQLSVPNVIERCGTEPEMCSPVRVEIYVADHCYVCEYAYEIADAIRQNFPQVDLRIVNVADAMAQIPEVVFATPTYLLNGRIWSLGNPSWEEVRVRLSGMPAA